MNIKQIEFQCNLCGRATLVNCDVSISGNKAHYYCPYCGTRVNTHYEYEPEQCKCEPPMNEAAKELQQAMADIDAEEPQQSEDIYIMPLERRVSKLEDSESSHLFEAAARDIKDIRGRLDKLEGAIGPIDEEAFQKDQAANTFSRLDSLEERMQWYEEVGVAFMEGIDSLKAKIEALENRKSSRDQPGILTPRMPISLQPKLKQAWEHCAHCARILHEIAVEVSEEEESTK